MSGKKLLVFIMAMLLLVLIEIYYEVNYPGVNNVAIQTGKIPKGDSFKILQLSDVHGKQFNNNNETLLQLIKSSEPDIIVITGDLIDRNTADFKEIYQFIDKLMEINPNIYFVSGNHEWANKNTTGFLEGLSQRGVVLLNNSNAGYSVNGKNINICGVDEYYSNHADLRLAVRNVNKRDYTVLLSHSPGIVNKGDLPVDLVLCGHTHGGQVRLPFIGGIIAPGQGLFPKLQKGVYNLDQGKYLYIDSGLGTSVYPVRFLNRSQMSLITIKGVGPAGSS